MARIFRKLAQLLDVDLTSTPPGDGDGLVYDAGAEKWVPGAGGGGGGAPTDVNYLVGTADSGLSAEIVVGTTPGGELGGTWASPTVDATHSGSSHASVQAAAEATAAGALSAHASDTTGVHGIADTSALLDTGDIGSSVAAQSHVHAGEDITSGTVADARIASTIARDSEVTSAISALSSVYQAKDTTLDTYAGIDPSANVQSVLSAADYAAIRTLLGLVIGTNVQAYDADLTTYAGITPSANVQSLLGAADYAAMRTLLGLVIGTNVQAYDADLSTWAGLTPSAFFQTLVDDTDAATARATLGVIASLFQSGGAQAIKLDDLATPDDNTDLNASTSAHGLLRKLDNNSAHFLDGTGAWSTPAGGSTDGWTAAGETWTYASADAPTFTFTISGVDLTTKYSAGMRVKLTQTTDKYFIITKVAFSTDTTITVYGGTDYTLANASITNPYWSMVKSPFGFPLDPAKWTVEVTDTTTRVQSTPTQSTWYNPGSITISVPIGAWSLEYEVNALISATSSVHRAFRVTLSTANNSESDPSMSAAPYGFISVGESLSSPVYRRRHLALTAKTSYFLNAMLVSSASGVSNIGFFNDTGGGGNTCVIRAVCAYL